MFAQLRLKVIVIGGSLDDFLEELCNLSIFIASVAARLLALVETVRVATLGTDGLTHIDRSTHVSW